MIIKVKVLPRSSLNEIVGEMPDGTLKVKLTAAPVDGKANEKLVELLAKEYEVSKSMVRIVRGETSTIKMVEIEGQ